MNFLKPLTGSIAAVLTLSGCASTAHWEERYERLSDPLIQEYQEKALKLDNELLNYQVNLHAQSSPAVSRDITETSENSGTALTPTLTENSGDVSAPIPTSYQAWWQDLLKQSFNKNTKPTYATLSDLFIAAANHSHQIRVFSDLPLIRRTSIDEAEGRFDLHAFAEAVYREEDEPIGSTLQTGRSQGRFKEEEWFVKAGVRKPLITGGEIELSQRLGVLDNNSEFLIPHDQGHARLALSFRQPLLNGSGITYNDSTIAVAKVDHEIALDEFVRQTEAHLLEIHRSYWGLYLERANLLQKKKLVAETQTLVDELAARLGIDTLASDLQMARATLAVRQTDSIRAEQAVRNAEGKLLALINSPDLPLTRELELIPNDNPVLTAHAVELSHAVQRALQHRPEIKQAFKQLKAGVIRLQMAEKEILPILDFILTGYLAGLEGDRDYNQAFKNEFDIGGPGYSVGLLFDMPLDNQVAKARERRRQLEVRQLVSQLRTTIDTVLLEVQVAAREVDTAFREFNSAYAAMQASEAHLNTLSDRRKLSQNQQTDLQRLLDAQANLTQREHAFLMSYIAYNVSLMNLQRAQGQLLTVNKLEIVEETEEDSLEGLDLPILKIRPVSHRE
ncbi:TolC family protein [Thioflexithrix psekupsensis]|uniref:Transporter n=1 Tax=Thioflexithrix psekupsensis TaxID=1570016 RepID=A0A251XAM3_9GAMM|nr:TolC family protein [Thioflexithrix psekupsensis]OUD14572.1 hypothetical protein TPSD3_09805 [Thioflexithrix psekupsensis]